MKVTARIRALFRRREKLPPLERPRDLPPRTAADPRDDARLDQYDAHNRRSDVYGTGGFGGGSIG